ncbi:MAG: 30S ribosomal protein S6 [Chloroflexi bacterium]|nr:30S ribosomal protein S6 [Chloroflexota bacterium]MBI5081651.1 30S ribosomal protein S6 [Chloroflexota bacterium]MBI5712770.1 30S ribosomal protein S6 [Chloroflexota bacterium]
MPQYEIAFIVHPEVDENGVAELAEKAQGWVTAGGGTVEKAERQGKKRLAYPIRKQREGHYVLLQTAMKANAPLEIERNLRLTEQVIRFMITKVEPVVLTAPVEATAEIAAPTN